MSIRDEIKDRVAERRLFFVRPALPTAAVERHMFASADLNQLILGPWDSAEEEIRCGRLRADLDAYLDGSILAVTQLPYRKKKPAYFAPLDPTDDAVWEIRSRDPKPGLRVLGHFSEFNVFIALTWERRHSLGGPGSREWRDAIERCKAEWRKLLPTYPPYKGNGAHDYLSNIILV